MDFIYLFNFILQLTIILCPRGGNEAGPDLFDIVAPGGIIPLGIDGIECLLLRRTAHRIAAADI